MGEKGVDNSGYLECSNKLFSPSGKKCCSFFLCIRESNWFLDCVLVERTSATRWWERTTADQSRRRRRVDMSRFVLSASFLTPAWFLLHSQWSDMIFVLFSDYVSCQAAPSQVDMQMIVPLSHTVWTTAWTPKETPWTEGRVWGASEK